MMILASKLFRAPVIAIGSGKIGEIGDPIINIDNGQLLAFHILPTGLFQPEKVISLVDIIVFDPKVIIINKPESVIEPKEVVRIQESIEKKFILKKSKAYTQNNTYLGKIEDAVIDSDSNSISKYYIKNIFRNRILPSEKVIEIKKNKIIFSDSVNENETEAGKIPI